MWLRAALMAALVILGAAADYLLWERRELSALRPQHALQARIEILPHAEGRNVSHVTLDGGELGPIGIVVDLPDPLPAQHLPLVIVLGGEPNGTANIRYITGAGDNAVIGYDWPVPLNPRANAATLAELPALYRHALSIPAQIASAIEWCAAQPWADSGRVSVLGFSLGALAAPTAEDLAERDGIAIGWTILAYGGAPLEDLVAADPHLHPAWLRRGLPPLIRFFLAPLQPADHLPSLKGRFLVLQGRNDNLIPDAARARLRDAVPEPKEIATFEGVHMGVGADKLALLRDIMRVSRDWLLRQNAVNRPANEAPPTAGASRADSP
jgi:hypothetical protein